MEIMLAIVIAVWAVCGILTYGRAFAYSQREFPLIAKEMYRMDLTFSIILGLLGPAGLIAVFLMCGISRHGLKWK